ncbi:TPA: restriction endonuclease [Pseudomonas aeruginosa]|nr:restriction endonuclease [Pseudomonas aeruginosa]HEP8928741.1 restriction endonuclease [Pseudomonas aeruginosa]
MTITEAIKQVMKSRNSAMTVGEAYRAIVDAGLYEFHADNPEHIVRSQIRRHCEGLDFPSSAPTKYFRLVGENRYEPIEMVVKQPSKRSPIAALGDESKRNSHTSSLFELQSLHVKYINELKRKILGDLKRMSPAGFEMFSKQLLDVYGFHGTKVTQVSGDGGIDGYGELKVGLASLNVAFQCKRWVKGNIQRPEIDKFRGAAQGDFEQGIFFTTSSFSEGAVAASIKRGAVPIILIDGAAIVDLMIEKGFGVQIETLLIPSYALDLALGSDDLVRNTDSEHVRRGRRDN